MTRLQFLGVMLLAQVAVGSMVSFFLIRPGHYPFSHFCIDLLGGGIAWFLLRKLYRKG